MVIVKIEMKSQRLVKHVYILYIKSKSVPVRGTFPSWPPGARHRRPARPPSTPRDRTCNSATATATATSTATATATATATHTFEIMVKKHTLLNITQSKPERKL
jgi:hypothetical protein